MLSFNQGDDTKNLGTGSIFVTEIFNQPFLYNCANILVMSDLKSTAQFVHIFPPFYIHGTVND